MFIKLDRKLFNKILLQILIKTALNYIFKMFLKFYCHKIYRFSRYQLSKFTLCATNLANVNVRFGTFLQILIEKCKTLAIKYQIKCRTYPMQQTVPIFNPLILRSIYTCDRKIVCATISTGIFIHLQIEIMHYMTACVNISLSKVLQS